MFPQVYMFMLYNLNNSVFSPLFFLILIAAKSEPRRFNLPNALKSDVCPDLLLQLLKLQPPPTQNDHFTLKLGLFLD